MSGLAAWASRWTPHRVHVVAETGSTMDAARDLGLEAGEVVVAERQVAGRGRLGRAWADTRGEGVALTLAMPVGPPERRAIEVAIGVAAAAEAFLDRPLAIKWPNDVLVDGRKLSGILVERVGDVDLVGVGINVNQTAWPASIADRAISLLQARGGGDPIDRVAVVAAALRAIDDATRLDDEGLRDAFRRRDVLLGRRARFRSGPRELLGEVVELDPLRGLAVAPTDGGDPVWLPAATTTVL